MRKRNRVLFTAVLAAVLMMAGWVQAAIIYSSFGAGESYGTSAFIVGDVFGMAKLEQAYFFVPTTTNYYLESVDVALEHQSGSDQVNVHIAINNGGTPGAVLETQSVTAPASDGVVSASFSGSTVLNQNNIYWVWLSAVDDGSVKWLNAGIALEGDKATSANGGSSWNEVYDNYTAFSVNGTVTAVPEPASVLLIGLGSGFIFLFRKLKAGFGLL